MGIEGALKADDSNESAPRITCATRLSDVSDGGGNCTAHSVATVGGAKTRDSHAARSLDNISAALCATLAFFTSPDVGAGADDDSSGDINADARFLVAPLMGALVGALVGAAVGLAVTTRGDEAPRLGSSAH